MFFADGYQGLVVLVDLFGQVIPHLKALGLLDLIVQCWINSMMFRHVIRHSVKSTIKIGAVAM